MSNVLFTQSKLSKILHKQKKMVIDAIRIGVVTPDFETETGIKLFYATEERVLEIKTAIEEWLKARNKKTIVFRKTICYKNRVLFEAREPTEEELDKARDKARERQRVFRTRSRTKFRLIRKRMREKKKRNLRDFDSAQHFVSVINNLNQLAEIKT